MGPYPDSTAVFDIDSIGLTNVVRRLNQGLDPGGNPIGEPTRFVVGVALNQGAEQRRELERYAWKVEAGADFAVTQPVFDPEQLARFLGSGQIAGAGDCRDLAPHLAPERGVPRERGARGAGAVRRSSSGCGRRRNRDLPLPGRKELR